MKDELITKETAILAKEKEFNNGCGFLWGEYDGYEGLHWMDNFNQFNNDKQFSAPTQSLLQCWLREIYDIQVYAYSNTIYIKNNVSKHKDYVVYINGEAINDARDGEFRTYEQALEIGLQVALERI